MYADPGTEEAFRSMLGHLFLTPEQREPEILRDEWHGCYGETWKGTICEEAFQHPAKYGRALIRRIYAHGKAERWLSPGSIILDPFGGVSLGALDAMLLGCTHISVELEEKFHLLAKENVSLWTRKFGELPGWGSAALLHGDSRKLKEVLSEQVSLICSSPPYTRDGLGHDGGCVRLDKKEDTRREQEGSARRKAYGQTEGQLGVMREGSVDSVISSPPYGDQRIADVRHLHFDEKRRQASIARKTARGVPDGYGVTPGQLGALKEGNLAAIISSPPFVGSLGAAANRPETKFTRPFLPPKEEVSAYLRERRSALQLSRSQIDEALGTATLYSWYEGRPAGTEIPTPERWRKLKEVLHLDDRFDAGILHVEEIKATSPNTVGKTGHARMVHYGVADGQLGNSQGDTFWSAAQVIVSQSYDLLKPGGVAVWVVKAFVRKGKLVDFPGQWRTLCESVGFITLHEHHAMLTETWQEDTLFEGTVKKERKRASFFRRLAEKKGSPPINYETVLCMQKRSEE